TSTPPAGRSRAAIPRGPQRTGDGRAHGMPPRHGGEPGVEGAGPAAGTGSPTRRRGAVGGAAMTTKLDDLLRDTIGGLADEARPADLARGALRQARGMRTRRRAGAGAAVAAGVLAVGALGSVVLPGWHPLPPAGGITQTATPAPSTTP